MRLSTQRNPGRLHVRKNSRWYYRGYRVNPHPVWGDTLEVAPSDPPPPPPPEPDPTTDPGMFTVAEIQAWVDDHPDLADEVLASEQARPAPRTTLVDWLQGFISHRDEGTIP